MALGGFQRQRILICKVNKMTEKIIISKELNEWLEEHQTLDTDEIIGGVFEAPERAITVRSVTKE